MEGKDMDKIDGADDQRLNGAVHVDDDRVQAAVAEAARAACNVLDEAFPGRDAGGITSNFQGLLEQLLTEMVNGRDPSSRHQTALPKLALADDDFGRDDPAWAAYFVVRTTDGWVLNWSGTQFVAPARNQENVDAWVSRAAAVQEAIKCIAKGMCGPEEIKVVGVSHAAFKAQGALASTPTNRLTEQFTPAAVMVCGLMDFRLISDLEEDERGQPRGVYAVGTNGDPDAGLPRVVATPWFPTVQDLDLFCKQNMDRYQAIAESDAYPENWFWESEPEPV